MDSPLVLRGKYYNTRFTYRCPNYNACQMCQQCRSYNKSNAMCVWCESGKNPELLCNHTDSQINSFIKIQMMFNRPLSHIDDKPEITNQAEKGLHNEASLMEAEKNLSTLGIDKVTQY